MNAAPAPDEKVDSSYGDPRLRRAGLNPYERRPERSSWKEWEVWERPDGSRYRKVREASRWGEVYWQGEWTTAEVTP